MKTATLSSQPLRRGFSLFEVLMVVSIIGIITAIAVPMMNNQETFYAARDRRNAQELVNTSMMAQAAGLDFIKLSSDKSLEGILQSVSNGGMVSTGPLKGRSFAVPGLSQEDIAGAAKYVSNQNGELRYIPESDESGARSRPGSYSNKENYEDRPTR
jgi:prepilin-type N-terminal cleavage/methylation domain-containing protein